jgi:hypothetical protein
MSITDDKVRELLSLRESEKLDFKGSPGYDFTNNNAKAEFIRDVVSLANLLAPDDAPAHILLGVEEHEDGIGEAKGYIPHPKYDNDADLQGLLRGKLNRVPRVRFSLHDIDGATVGVIQVLPGGRPFFAITEKWGLETNRAWIRRGSSRDIATPQEIWDWALLDEKLAVERDRLEQAKAQVRPRGRVEPCTCPKLKNRAKGRKAVEWSTRVHNMGPVPFSIVDVTGHTRHEEHGELPLDVLLETDKLVSPGESRRIHVFAYVDPQWFDHHFYTLDFSGSFSLTVEGVTGEQVGIEGEIVQ